MSAPDHLFMLTAPAEGPICDFCSSPDVRWSYPCRDHNRQAHAEALIQRPDGSLRVEEMDIEGFSHGGWAACSACHALIQRGDRDRLARRSAKRMIRNNPDIPLVLSNATEHVRRLHDQFWANRDGPPVHHDSRPTEDPTR